MGHGSTATRTCSEFKSFPGVQSLVSAIVIPIFCESKTQVGSVVLPLTRQDVRGNQLEEEGIDVVCFDRLESENHLAVIGTVCQCFE